MQAEPIPAQQVTYLCLCCAKICLICCAICREVADSVALDFWLQPGDLQLVHNHTQVHNRSAYEDYEVRARCYAQAVCLESRVCQ
jgi:hypothetical protein